MDEWRGEGVEGSRKEATTNGFTFVPSPFPLKMLRTGPAGGTNGLGSE